LIDGLTLVVVALKTMVFFKLLMKKMMEATVDWRVFGSPPED
jgi:hypothetical protein